jgi:hypothetical protein
MRHQNTGFSSAHYVWQSRGVYGWLTNHPMHKYSKYMVLWEKTPSENTQDSHKHAKTSIYDRAYETPKYGILISTLKQAYMIVLMRHQNTGFSSAHYVWQSRGVYGWLTNHLMHKYSKYMVLWEKTPSENTQDSHKHVKTSIYERAHETPKYGILISTLKQAYMIVLMRHQNTQDSHKHVKTSIYDRAYETRKYGILISTLKYAYRILISTLKQAYLSVLVRHQITGFS